MRPTAGVLLLGVILTAGCAETPPVVVWGRQCQAEMDPDHRLDLVRQIMATGDERAIPVLIECLATVKRDGKTPDRVYRARAIVPNDTAPPEFWALHVLTGQDFDLDVDRWSAWYELHRGRLAWDGGRRRFADR
jgi:hypothetical protein